MLLSGELLESLYDMIVFLLIILSCGISGTMLFSFMNGTPARKSQSKSETTMAETGNFKAPLVNMNLPTCFQGILAIRLSGLMTCICHRYARFNFKRMPNERGLSITCGS